MMLPYINFMKNAGITVRLLRLQWHTSLFNRAIVKWSHRLPSFYKKSFVLGVYCSIILFPIAVVLLLISVFDSGGTAGPSKTAGSEGPSSQVHLEILLPGVNLPISQFGYYIAALLISSVVHEFGHGKI
jgi:S2P endopeptidase